MGQTRSYGMKIAELPLVIQRAQDRFKQIKQKHPQLSGYLVFSLRGNQARLKDSPGNILAAFKDFFVDNSKRQAAWSLIEQRDSLDRISKRNETDEKSNRKRIDEFTTRIEAQALTLEINYSVQVEIRFDELDYDIVHKLRCDDLVDKDLTPQIAGIRITLGTVWDFEEGWSTAK